MQPLTSCWHDDTHYLTASYAHILLCTPWIITSLCRWTRWFIGLMWSIYNWGLRNTTYMIGTGVLHNALKQSMKHEYFKGYLDEGFLYRRKTQITVRPFEPWYKPPTPTRRACLESFSNISQMYMCGRIYFLHVPAKLMTSLGTRLCAMPQCQRWW